MRDSLTLKKQDDIMSDKKLQLKTPLRNMVLNLRDDVNHATKAALVDASLGRKKGYYFERLVFTYSEIDNCYLSVNGNDCALWIGKACFEVRAEDVDLIATTFDIKICRSATEPRTAEQNRPQGAN